MARNAGFLLRNIPQARARASAHLSSAVRLAREIGAKGVLGQALTDLGRLQRAVGDESEATVTLSEAVTVLESIAATGPLQDARWALEEAGIGA